MSFKFSGTGETEPDVSAGEIEIYKILDRFVSKLVKPEIIKKPLPLVKNTFSSLPNCLLRVSKCLDGKLMTTCAGEMLHNEDTFDELGMLGLVTKCNACGGYTSAMILTEKNQFRNLKGKV